MGKPGPLMHSPGGNCCHQPSGVLLLLLSIWGKEVGSLRMRRLWEVLNAADRAGRDESHPVGLNLVSCPEECWGTIEGLVDSRLPDRRLEAYENRWNQPSWCYLLCVFPSEQEQGAVWTLPLCCCSNTQTPTEISAHPDVSKYRCALLQRKKPIHHF